MDKENLQGRPAANATEEARSIHKHSTLTFSLPLFRARVFRVRVMACFMPSRCVPPSLVRMLLAYPRMVSE